MGVFRRKNLPTLNVPTVRSHVMKNKKCSWIKHQTSVFCRTAKEGRMRKYEEEEIWV